MRTELDDHAAPDPLAEARAYQDFLLAALGDDDPAEAAAETPGSIRVLFRMLGGHDRVHLAQARRALEAARAAASGTNRA